MINANEQKVKNEILLKLNVEQPYRYSQTNVVTAEARAYFPYMDWFRGDYMSECPIIAEREAGFRPREERTPLTGCPDMVGGEAGHAYPQHCFRSGLLTHYPCYPECTETFKRNDPTLMRQTKLYLFR